MKITFKCKHRKFEAEVEDIEEIYEAVKGGVVAMGYHKDNAHDLVEELKHPDEPN